MIKDGYISKQISVEILEKFFQVNCSFDKLYEIFKAKRTRTQLEKFVRNKFKQLILDIESNLYRAGYITKLKFYDHNSDTMFDELVAKASQFFNQQLVLDFIYEEKCKLMKHEKSPSYKRIQIYNQFVKYAETNNLFILSIQTSQLLSSEKRPYESPCKLYPSNQLELINVLYQLHLGDYMKIQETLQSKKYTTVQYTSPILYQNLNNLELIGLFRCYRKAVIWRGGKGMRWGEFVKDQSEFMEEIKTWDRNLLCILIRIAIRGISEASPMQIRIICGKIDRRYDDKPVIEGRQLQSEIWDRMGLMEGMKNQSQEVNKLRVQLLALVNSKVWFSPVNDKQPI